MVLYSPPRKQELCLYCVDDHDIIFPPPHDFRKQYNNIFITKFRFGGKVAQSSVLIDQSIEKKNVYVASGIEPATINLSVHNIIFLRLIASYKVQNFGIKSIRQQSIRHTNLANVSGKYRDQKFPRNIHISCPTGSRMKLLLTSLFATQGRILYQASKEKWFTRLGQSRRSVNLSSVSTVPYSRKIW